MKSLLCSVIVLLALATVCHANCKFTDLVVPDAANPPQGCLDKDRIMRDFGAEWKENCIECTCYKDGINCCNLLPDAEDVPPECEMIVNKEKCSAKLVMKSDPSKDCELV